jgi:hypothetical protein
MASKRAAASFRACCNCSADNGVNRAAVISAAPLRLGEKFRQARLQKM